MAIPYAPEPWNWMTGCSEVSEGCKHCWAKETIRRHRDLPGYNHDKPFTVTFHPERLDKPRHWRKPRVISECFMGDPYHENVLREWRDRAWAVKRDCPQHTFITSTKRPLRMATEVLWLERVRSSLLDNVWHGISVENQKTANDRVGFVEHVDRGWISCEPMLEAIDWPIELHYAQGIIVGAESGKDARPFDPAWAEATQEACKRAGVCFYMKQMDAKNGGANWDKWPESLKHLKIRQLPWKLKDRRR